MKESLPIRLSLTDVEGLELYRFLTDDRPEQDKASDPLSVSNSTIARLHVALRERSMHNKLCIPFPAHETRPSGRRQTMPARAWSGTTRQP
jgi:hypothetical protein